MTQADALIDTALAGLATGRPEAIAEGAAALTAAARDGRAEAGRWLAVLAGLGVGMAQDWEAALDHLLTAAQGGSVSARGQLIALSPLDPAALGADSWTVLRASVRIADWLAPGVKQVVNAAPRTVAVAGFIPPRVCAWLIGRAAGGLKPAMTYGADGVTPVPSAGRTNSAMEFGLADSDLVLLLLRARIAANIGLPVGALEASQVLHYRPGESFALHFDWLDPARREVAERGQRIVTFLVYLNDDFTGGETDFPRTGVRHRGATGDGLYFANLDASGAPDRRTLHAGLAPTSGEKWVFSQWVRNMVRM